MPEGVIVKSISSRYSVKTDDGIVVCGARGRLKLDKKAPLVGDSVEISLLAPGEGMIESVAPRRNSFIRPSVANVDALVMVCADVNPVTDPFLIDRIAAIAELKDCEPVVVVNKTDLKRSDRLFGIYSGAGFTTIRTSAATGEGVEELRAALRGKISVFTGNSGVGKSSLLNALDPGFAAATGEVSEKLGRGRHKTRHVELYMLEEDTMIIDTPGFSSFDAEEGILRKTDLQYAFREFAPYLGNCRFNDCAHVKDEGCSVLAALAEGKIAPERHASYVRLYEQAAAVPEWELKD
ncbi:MAG: ribosome small subunit-dependent GTPase A [Oscillospiraceae bacterium]|nr:ribosome small subunit-dependent GTPase A [Oscillospiraceae bacterium]